MAVSDEQFQLCKQLIAPRGGPLKVRSDPRNVVLKDGIYVEVRLGGKNKWLLSIYRDRCLGSNELEVSIDPQALALFADDPADAPEIDGWIRYQQALLENEPARKRIHNSKVSSISLGFTVSGAHEFLRRLESEVRGPFPSRKFQIAKDGAAKFLQTQEHGKRQVAVAHMLAMAFQAAAASGTQRVEIAKVKEVRFESAEVFKAYVEQLLEDQRCAITRLLLDMSFKDPELAPSLDRKDSSGHYEPGNLQVVARFVNRWKSDDDQGNFERLIRLLRADSDHL